MHPVRAGGQGQARVAIDQRPRTIVMAEVDGGMDEGGPARRIERRLTQLHQLEATLQCVSQSHELRVDADLAGMGDGVKIRQGQRGQHRRIGRQHR
jgi:hypothetical protein